MMTITKEPTIRGYKLNNPANYPGLYEEPTMRLIHLVEYSPKRFTRPLGYHIRLRLADGVSISSLIDRLSKPFSRAWEKRKPENTFRPLALWACEIDPGYRYYDDDGAQRRASDSGKHYHIAFIIDGHKASTKALHTLRSKFVEMGLVLDMAIVPTLDSEGKKAYCKRLAIEAERDEYVIWLSYICKVRSKEKLIGTGQRVWGSSQLPN